MRVFRLAGAAIAGLILNLCSGAAGADETYGRTVHSIEGAVSVVAFSPDGTRIAFAEGDGPVHIRDADAGSEVARIDWPYRDVHFAAFSPDGARIVVLSVDERIGVFETESGAEISVHALGEGQTLTAAFGPDGVLVATAGTDGVLRVVDAQGGGAVAVFGEGVTGGDEGGLLDVAFSADGRRVATASREGPVRVRDTATGREIAAFAHDAPVDTVAFSPDAARIATGDRAGVVRVFDAAGGAAVAELGAEGVDEVTAVAFNADGTRILVGDDDGSLHVWDLASGERVALLADAHLRAVRTVAFSPDGARLLTTGHDATGRVWTRLDAAPLPEGIAGVWLIDYMAPDEEMTADFARELCLAVPIAVGGDGVIVFFEGYGEAPQPTHHLRCAADGRCGVYGGPPAQGLEAMGEGEIRLSIDGGEICLMDECQPVVRCPAIEWSEEERASGLAEAWEARVLNAGR